MTGIEGFSATMLLGPMGGVVALAYAAGAASGWGFCVLTVLRITNKQITRLEGELEQERNDCDRRISALEARVREVEDRYTHGMERQLGQIRESSLRHIRRDDD